MERAEASLKAFFSISFHSWQKPNQWNQIQFRAKTRKSLKKFTLKSDHIVNTKQRGLDHLFETDEIRELAHTTTPLNLCWLFAELCAVLAYVHFNKAERTPFNFSFKFYLALDRKDFNLAFFQTNLAVQ